MRASRRSIGFPCRVIMRRRADRLGEARIGVAVQRLDDPALDRRWQSETLEDERRIELHEAGARLDLGESSRRAIDAADADQRELAFDPLIRGGEHLRR